jgi:glutathione S-transferase
VIKLYDYELSSDCYKVRLLAEFLDLSLDRVPVDVYPGGAHETAAFRSINPLGELPVLDDGGFLLRESQAILVYLASRYDVSGRWYGVADPAMLGAISQWLAFAARISATAARARLHDNMFIPADIEACRRGAHALFRILDEHLWFAEQAGQRWLCSREHPTIADLACFPDVMLSEEGGVSRLAYPAIRRWTDRVKGIPKFILMPGIFPVAPPACSETLAE